LYGIHALLTGIAMALMHMLGVHLGFGFSAGLFDYVLNFSQSTRPWALLPVGALYFGVYYGLFRFFILRFDLKTLGREADEITPAGHTQITDATPALAWIRALGSAANLRAVEACTTRLRLVVVDQGKGDEPRLKALGARGLLRPSAQGLQVVVGPIADQVATEMRVAAGTLATPAPRVSTEAAPPLPAVDAKPWLAAIGGRANLIEGGAASSRVWLRLRDPAQVDFAALKRLGTRAIVTPTNDVVHLIIGADAAPLAIGLVQ